MYGGGDGTVYKFGPVIYHHTKYKPNPSKGFGNKEVLKTSTSMDTNAYANTDAGDSTTALRELCSGELKILKFRTPENLL